MSNKHRISHDEFLKYINKLCDTIPFLHIDTIIGLGRGGYVPSVYISHKLGVDRVISMVAKSYTKDNTRGKLDFLQEPVLTDNNKRILVVDDIVDSGSTFLNVKNWFNINYPSKYVVFAALVYKQQHLFSDVVYGCEAPADQWVVFPWETSD